MKIMKKLSSAILLYTLAAVLLYPSNAVAVQNVDIAFTTIPEVPHNFQPFFEGNQPAKVVLEVRDADGRLIKNVNVKIDIQHVKGFSSGQFLSTGFPYLEGKKVFSGEFFLKDGRLEFSYIFPIRGTYNVKIDASATEKAVLFEPTTRVFEVKVQEWGYQIRNAVILVLLMLGLGLFIGRVYARAKFG